MKKMEKTKIEELKTLNKSSSSPHHLSHLPLLQQHHTIFSKNLVNALQQELKQKYGYQMSKSSLPVLALYFQYFALLKQVISNKRPQARKINSFPKEYSKYHSHQEVSQLLLQIYNKNTEFKKESAIYRQQCLLQYLGIDQVTEEKALPYLVDKISRSKNSGLIRFQAKKSKKKERNFFPLIDKENKIRHYQYFSSVQTRKNIADSQSDIYYQILALKMLLKEENPDPLQTNQVCQEIKVNLEGLFNTIKLKNIPHTYELHLNKKSILMAS